MKAIVRDEYGAPEVLKLEEVNRPVPKDDEVLVRVRASSLNRADLYGIQGFPMLLRLAMGLFKPRVRGVGLDFAGDIVEVGALVDDLQPGEPIYGQASVGQTWAEYVCVPASLTAPKPKTLSYEQAAAVPLSALTALQGLRNQGQVTEGTSALINGATGAVGTFAVQIAKALGAREVTAVCSERNVELVRSLGADHVIPYESEDLLACDRKFDLFFDGVGNRPLRACLGLLNATGIFVASGAPDTGRWLGPVKRTLSVLTQAVFVPQKVKVFVGTPNQADLLTLTELIESGKVTPAIDRVFPLEETPDAVRYLIEGRPSSKVVLKV